ncbi:MAG: MATE family efflux transporter [Romboutsia sp.]
MDKNIYEEKSLNELIFMFGVPSILALIIEMLTSVADTYFAGHIPIGGDTALSAMAILSPLLSSFTALQTLFAMSSGILMAKYLNDSKIQYQCLLVGVFMSMLISAIVSFVCAVWIDPILYFIGADGQIYSLAKEYLRIHLISNVISSVGYTLTCCIRAIGYPKIEMIIIIVAVIINIISNAIFTFGLNMGISGLAFGTLVSELVCACAAIIFLIKKNIWRGITYPSFSKIILLATEMFKIGFAQTVIQILSGCSGFFVNIRLLSLGNTVSVAAWNVAQRIYILLLMPIVGLTQGIQTIIAYFGGIGEEEKVQKISKLAHIYCACYGLLALILVLFWGDNVVKLFGGNQEIIKLSNSIVVIIFSCFPIVGIFYTNMTLLQVTGKEMDSVVLALTRQVFLLLPLILLIPYLFSATGRSPLIGLFIATPVADISVVIISMIMKKKSLKKYE